MLDSIAEWFLYGCSILSVLGCLYVLVVYYSLKQLQTPALTMVKNLAIFDLWYSTSGFYPTDEKFSCQLQAFCISTGSMLILLWTTAISLFLYMKIVRSWVFDDSAFITKALIAVFSLTGLQYLLPFSHTKFEYSPYGKQPDWCWIRLDSQTESAFWEIGLFYGPLFVFFLVNAFLTLRIVRVLTHSPALLEQSEGGVSETVIKVRLWLYPCTILFCFLPCACYRVAEAANSEQPNILTVCAATSPLAGFCTFLIYAMNPSVRNAIKSYFRSRRQVSTGGRSLDTLISTNS